VIAETKRERERGREGARERGSEGARELVALVQALGPAVLAAAASGSDAAEHGLGGVYTEKECSQPRFWQARTGQLCLEELIYLCTLFYLHVAQNDYRSSV